MAKKRGLPSHTRTVKKSAVSPLSGNHSIAKDGVKGRGVATGIEGLRHSVTKPSKSSGTQGYSGALKEVGTDTDKRNTTLGRSYIKTKPSK